MRLAILTQLLLAACLTVLNAQQRPPAPPENLNGDRLADWLHDNWYEDYHRILGYDRARIAMYSDIDNDNGRIECVYSGFIVRSPKGKRTTYPQPINAEHVVPQSTFSKAEPMKSDLHHLFPTYENWNRLRRSYPFAEIDDRDTELWLLAKAAEEDLPDADIRDMYSEFDGRSFEPREDFKGDIARAVLYFYTAYPRQGDPSRIADLETLCAWHRQDPPSAEERKRNDRIAYYQGNRNFYIDHPELVARVYECPTEVTVEKPAITPPATPTYSDYKVMSMTVESAPGAWLLRLRYPRTDTAKVYVRNAMGKELFAYDFELKGIENMLRIPTDMLQKGKYTLEVDAEGMLMMVTVGVD